MSDAQKLIAEVMEQHQEYIILGDYWVAKCSPTCGWIGNQPYGFRNNAEEAHRGHVAAEIDKALGVLTRERRPINSGSRAKPCNKCGHNKGEHGTPCRRLMRNFTECGCPSYEYTEPTTEWAGRWVSGWSEVQP